MALVDCEECGEEISEEAPTCPNCGHPTGSGTPKESGDGGGRGFLFWMIATIVLLAASGIVYAINLQMAEDTHEQMMENAEESHQEMMENAEESQEEMMDNVTGP
jgi:uncharacterized protein HemX